MIITFLRAVYYNVDTCSDKYRISSNQELCMFLFREEGWFYFLVSWGLCKTARSFFLSSVAYMQST